MLRVVPVLAVLLGSACGSASESATDALLDLERLSLVPAGVRTIQGYADPFATHVVEHALLVDRYELTRGDWLRAAPEGFATEVGAKWTAPEGAVPEDTLAWPATWMTQAEAREMAALRGMRLPTPSEWVFVVVGASVTPYPWGRTKEVSVCNTLGLGLDRLAAVGTFESGRAPTPGIYDLVGNAKEWVDGWVPDEEWLQDWARTRPPAGPIFAPAPDGMASAMGGSYQDRLRETFGPSIRGDRLVFHATTLHPDHRADDLGFRCVADARSYLWETADAWGRSEAARARIAAVARRWAESADPRQVARLLEELAAREEAPVQIAWLLEGTR